jgi:Acetyltransferase (GNAT) family
MQIIKHFTLDDFKEMQELERKFYVDDHITPYEEAYRWYKEYPYTVRALRDNEKIIGFVNMFPIKDHIFKAIQAGTFNDRDLVLEHIINIHGALEDKVNMFLCCIVIDQDYRRTDALSMLLRENIQYYEHIQTQIQSIITDNVTDKGESFSKRLGFKKVTDSQFDSIIYMGNYAEFVKSVFMGALSRS